MLTACSFDLDNAAVGIEPTAANAIADTTNDTRSALGVTAAMYACSVTMKQSDTAVHGHALRRRASDKQQQTYCKRCVDILRR